MLSPIFILHFCFNYVWPFLFPLAFLVKKDIRLLNYRYLLLPLCIVFTFVMFSSIVFGDVNTMLILGYDWQWSSLAIWIAAFTLQLLLYQKRLGNLRGLCMSLLGVALGSVLYELPWYISSGGWPYLLVYPKFIVAIGTFAWLFYHTEKVYRLNFDVHLLDFTVMSAGIYLVGCLFYHSIPIYLVRLDVFPLLLVLPFLLPKHDKHDCS